MTVSTALRKTLLRGLLAATSLLPLALQAQQPAQNATEKKVSQLFNTVSSRYSAQLDSLRDAINDYNRRYNAESSYDVTVFDPLKFDIALAFGLSREQAGFLIHKYNMQAAGGNMHRQPGLLSPETVAEKISYITKQKHIPAATWLGDTLTSYRPSVFQYNAYATTPGSFLTPVYETDIRSSTDDYATPFIEGMNLAQNIAFINGHEAWHARDGVNHAKLDIFEQNYVYVDDIGALGTLEPTQKVFSAEMRGEAFADIAAIGDMIRGGESINIIDHVIKWRLNRPSDVRHMSVISLELFRDALNKGGLQKLLKMNMREAAEYYQSFAVAGTLSPQAVGYFFQLGNNIDEVYNFAVNNEKHPQRSAALFAGALYHRLSDSSETAQPAALCTALTAAEKRNIRDNINAWDAETDMIDRAYAFTGNVTPETITKAYAALRDEILQKSLQEDDRTVAPVKLARLRHIFINRALKIDGQAETEKRRSALRNTAASPK